MTKLFNKLFILLLLFGAGQFISAQTKILPVGDLIVRGTTELGINYNFRRPLHIMLTNAGYSVDFVGEYRNNNVDYDANNQGFDKAVIDYDTADSTMAGFISLADTIYGTFKLRRPKIAIFYGGTHDYGVEGNNTSQVMKDVDSLFAAIDRYAEDYANDPRGYGDFDVLFVSLVGTQEQMDGGFTNFNTQIKQKIANRANNPSAYPARIRFVDVINEGGFDPASDMLIKQSGAIFPNESGYLKMAKVLYNQITQLISPSDTKPRLLSPADQSLVRSKDVTLNWGSLGTNKTYDVQIAKDSLFTELVVDTTVSDTSLTIANLTDSTKYLWRVFEAYDNFSKISGFTLQVLNVQAPTDLKVELIDSAHLKLQLTWTDNSDSEEGFILERQEGLNGTFAVYDTLAPNTTTFIDTVVKPNTYYAYRIKAFAQDLETAYAGPVATITPTPVSVEAETGLPKSFAMNQNYPNPFNPSTTIKYQMPASGHVTLKVFDILGNEIATLVNSNVAAGYHTVQFNANNLSSGIYLYQIKVISENNKNFVDTKKFMLMK